MKQLIVGTLIGAAGMAVVAANPGGFGTSAKAAEAAPPPLPQTTCSRAEELRNKQVATSLKPRTPAFYAAIDPNYVQHVPEYALFAQVNGLSGPEAVKTMEKYGFGATGRRLGPPPPLPGQPRDDFGYKVIAECDFVVAVGEHWHPVPNQPGRFYATYFFNMWRMKNGKLVEHWDPDDLPSPLPDYLVKPVEALKAG